MTLGPTARRVGLAMRFIAGGVRQTGVARECVTLVRSGRGRTAIQCCVVFICTCSITAMIVCIYRHVQWRLALTDRLALG